MAVMEPTAMMSSSNAEAKGEEDRGEEQHNHNPRVGKENELCAKISSLAAETEGRRRGDAD